SRVGNERAVPDEARANDRAESAEVISGQISFTPIPTVQVRDGGNRLEPAIRFLGDRWIWMFTLDLFQDRSGVLPTVVANEQVRPQQRQVGRVRMRQSQPVAQFQRAGGSTHPLHRIKSL